MNQHVYKRIIEKAPLSKGSAYPIKPYELVAYLEQQGHLPFESIRYLPPDEDGALVEAQHYLSSDKIVLAIFAASQGIITRATDVVWKIGLPSITAWIKLLMQEEELKKRRYRNIRLVMHDGGTTILQNTALYI